MTEELIQSTLDFNHSPSRTRALKVDDHLSSDTLDEQSTISSPSHIELGVDSGLSSDTLTHTEAEKSNADDESSSISGISSLHAEDVSPTSSGVIIPEEKRVTDRVKVFEAVANQDSLSMKNKNGNTKKSSSSINDLKQVSPSSVDSFETQSIGDLKNSTAKSKSKRTSLKKQLQNLLKIDKSSNHEDLPSVEEQTNGKKSSTLKRENCTREAFLLCAREDRSTFSF